MSLINTLLGRNQYIVVVRRKKGKLTLLEVHNSVFYITARTRSDATKKIMKSEQIESADYYLEVYDSQECLTLTWESLSRQQIEEINPIIPPKNYFSLFNQICRDYVTSESYTSLKKEIEKLEDEQLKKLNTNILITCTNNLRTISDISMSDHTTLNDWSLHIALTWHLSDVLHNLPALLLDSDKYLVELKKQYMINYICDYLVFSKALEKQSEENNFMNKYSFIISNHDLSKYSSLLSLTEAN